MKKSILILSMLLFVNISGIAQTRSQSAVDSARDYLVAKLAHEIIGTIISKEEKSKEEKVKSKGQQDRGNFETIEPSLLSNTIKTPLSNAKLSKLLKDNHFEQTDNLFVDRVTAFHIDLKKSAESIANDLVENVYLIAKNNKIRLQDSQKEYVSVISKFLNTVSIATEKKAEARAIVATQPQPQPQNLTADSVKEIIRNEFEVFNSFSSFKPNLWNIGIPIFFALIFILVFYSKLNSRATRQREAISELEKNINFNKPGNSTNSLSYNQMQKISSVDTISTIVASLQDEVSALKNKMTLIENTSLSKHNRDTPDRQPPNEPNRKQERDVFYMSTPVNDFFSIKSKSGEYIKGSTMYKFFPNYSQTEAQFEFISDEETIKYIQNSVFEVVRPACKFENAPSANTRRVITTEKGIARFDAGNWKIIEKAKINFE